MKQVLEPANSWTPRTPRPLNEHGSPWVGSSIVSLGQSEKAKAAVAELNALGLNYTLTSGGKAAKAGSAKGKGAIEAAACPICGFQTAPPGGGSREKSR